MADFIKRNKIILLVVFTLGLILLTFTMPFKEKSYIFDWDQAYDYENVAKIANGDLTLIGPRVTSDTGFFLGPWHYYFLLPFFKFTNGNLFMGFFAALFVQYLTAIIVFLLTKKYFGIFVGLITAITFVTPIALIEWGFMYIPLLSLLFFFTCLKTLNNPKTLPLLLFLFGFGCTTYTVFYALIIPLLYVVLKLFYDKKTTLKTIFFGIILALLPYLPLFVFDLRHNFLNLKNVLGFIGGQNGQGSEAGYFIKVFFRAIETSWLGHDLYPTASILVVLLSILILISGTIIIFNKNKMFIIFWLFSSLIPMAFYKGNVSEYYYTPVIILIPLFLSILLSKKGLFGKITLIFLTFLLTGLRLREKYLYSQKITLSDKIEIVGELEKIGERYSISYDLNLGEDSGYNTIFKKLGKNFVENGSAQLYTLTDPSNVSISGTKIFSTKKLSIYKR